MMLLNVAERVRRILFLSIAMSDAAYYRAEAQRMLEWARTSPHRDMAQRWSKLAEDYASLAKQLDASEIGRPPMPRMAMQMQPVQQQQSKRQDG